MKKILIIEDDQVVANIYRNKFSVEGYQVEMAFDGQAGLRSVRSFRPDAVGLTNLVQEAWKAGATKCLSKASCSPKQLISIVRSVVDGGKPSNGDSGQPPELPGAAPQADAKRAEQDATAELKKPLLDGVPATITTLRMLLQAATKERGPAQAKHLESMHRHAHALTGKAALAGRHQTAQMSDALEALVKELHEKPNNVNVSTLRTIASAIDFLGLLFEKGTISESPGPASANILVVDDEQIGRAHV